MLKVQLHIHTNSDPKEKKWINYSNENLIDKAHEKGFDVLSITCHEKIIFSEKLKKNAQKKGILLLPGVEIRMRGMDVLIVNAKKKAEEINSFKELKKYKYKNPDSLIIAPHPYYKMHSLGKKLERNLKLFDAVEYSCFYSEKLNPNKKVVKLGLPVLGTSDMHFIELIESTYSLIEAEKNGKSVIDAIRKGKIKIVTKPLTLKRMAGTIIKMTALTAISHIKSRKGKSVRS